MRSANNRTVAPVYDRRISPLIERRYTYGSLFRSVLLAAFLSVLPIATAIGSVPGWVLQAAQQTIPKYPEDTKAVELFEEQITATKNGNIETTHRQVYKILRPEGRSLGTLVLFFDKDTPIEALKAWTIAADGIQYETKEKEAVEVSFPGGGILYEDDRSKVLRIPAADPGSILAYEYTQRGRPYIRQEVWPFQRDIPVLRARCELDLSEGWEFHEFWSNYPAVKPSVEGRASAVWELSDIPATQHEPDMPDERAIAGTMVVTLLPPRGDGSTGSSVSGGTWPALGQWYGRLTEGRRELTPGLKKKVEDLTAATPNLLDKIRAVASFVQHDVRYVGIEIGIGGYQPHPADEVFSNRYGDCKDKATLLSAMLRALNVDSYYVLLSTRRGVVHPDFPTVRFFNHVILAISLPKGPVPPALYATSDDAKLGTLLFFDPTDPMTPLGYLPVFEQGSNALLVAPQSGELVRLPVLPPPLNRQIRLAQVQLTSDGSLYGNVKEIYWGALAAEHRARLLAVPESQREKTIESFVTHFLPGLVFRGAHIEDLEDSNKALIITYGFIAKGYAQPTGDILLVHTRLLGEKSLDLEQEEDQKRLYPVQLNSTSLESDIFQITLPSGYQVEELPSPVDFHAAFGEYKTKVSVDKNLLQYTRLFEINHTLIPAGEVDSVTTFFRQIFGEERSVAILRRSPAAPTPPTGGSR